MSGIEFKGKIKARIGPLELEFVTEEPEPKSALQKKRDQLLAELENVNKKLKEEPPDAGGSG